MGADVIKIESPNGGDGMRQWPPISKGYSENFASVNRNKRSVVLDLKDADDVARARQLVKSADVVIENFRPGVYWSAWDWVFQTSSRCSRNWCIAQSQLMDKRVRAHAKAAFDLTMQAMAGVMSVTGEPNAPPVKCGVPISDFAAGLYAAYAVVSALREVEKTGQGAHIDIPMLGATLGIGGIADKRIFWQ